VTVLFSGLRGRGERDHPSFARPILPSADIIDGSAYFPTAVRLALVTLTKSPIVKPGNAGSCPLDAWKRTSAAQTPTCGWGSKTPQWSKRCRAILGALQAALEDCNKALMSEPNSAAAYDSHDLIHLKMGRLGAAIDDYNPALRLVTPKKTFTTKSALIGRAAPS
jgi:tetratricopeptide (TPR) repeat protein